MKGQDRISALLTKLHAASPAGFAIALHVQQDRAAPLTRAQVVAVQRVHELTLAHRVRRRQDRLGGHLTAVERQAFVLARVPGPVEVDVDLLAGCLLYTSPSPRDS